jgi:hypothetical protein
VYCLGLPPSHLIKIEPSGVLKEQDVDGAKPFGKTDGGYLQRRDSEDFADVWNVICFSEINGDFSNSPLHTRFAFLRAS